MDTCTDERYAYSNLLATASVPSSTTASPSASSATLPSPSAADASPSANSTVVDETVGSNNTGLGNDYYAPAPGHSKSKDSWSASATATASASVTSADWSPSSTAVPSATPSSTWSGNSGSFAGTGALRTQGTKVVDSTGKEVVLKGTNLGGWLVFEDWMCGISDNSGNGDRFPQWTLEQRFGQAQTKELMNVWMDNWLVASDFDDLKALGFTLARLPFSYKNFINSDGSDNDVGFARLDWAVAQAKRVGIYLVPVYHIWDTQMERYSLISENSDDGQAARDKASALWKKIAARYLGEDTIAAWDAINEPTGSWGDLLQRNLYDAIRSVDKDRIIIQASIGTNPANYGWTNVIYTQHEYHMMGNDFGSNQAAYSAGPGASISDFSSLNIPTYIGEFMADGQTLDYMLSNLNNAGVWWSSWTLHTVQMDRWGLTNYGWAMNVDVSSDSYDAIRAKWSNMGSLTRQAIADQYQAATGAKSWKREEQAVAVQAVEPVPVQASPRVGRVHAGRSRHSLRHRAVAHAASF